MKTAVEWLMNELDQNFAIILNYVDLQKLIQQAKEMEKIEKIKVQIEALKEIDVSMNGWVTHQIFEKLKELRKQLKESELTFKSE